MHAVVITEPGEPEVLRWLEVPDPVPGPGEVVIEIAASGVNRADLMQRQGLYPPPPGAPPYPGLECSGRVAGLGPGTDGWQVGDEVCALLGGGGYAEKVAVPAGQLLPVPAGVDVTAAAAFPETACTVYSNVFQLARLTGAPAGASYERAWAALAPSGTVLDVGSGAGAACLPLADAPEAHRLMEAGAHVGKILLAA